jgi:hypothetical protein
MLTVEQTVLRLHLLSHRSSRRRQGSTRRHTRRDKTRIKHYGRWSCHPGRFTALVHDALA